KLLEAFNAPMQITCEHDLAVGARLKLITDSLQRLTQFDVVVYFAVVRHPHLPAGSGHRLMSARRQVDDAQASVAQSHVSSREGNWLIGIFKRSSSTGLIFNENAAMIIRPAMRNAIGHRKNLFF